MSDRLRSIVEQVEIRSDNRVVAFGCGQCVAARFACDRRESGPTAADRLDPPSRGRAPQ